MNTGDLDIVISDYLSAKDTDYAIMISGKWGCGKSYYISHGLKDLVERTHVPEDDSKLDKKQINKDKLYSLAYISLYGVSSTDDFDVKVFNGINSWIDNRFWRVTGMLTSKATSIMGFSFGKKDLKPIMKITSNKVLVFDDLERICEDKISIKEVLALINSYAEHSRLKVIVVCNENEYTSDGACEKTRLDYSKYKEKGIRFTYEFSPDVSLVYDAMVSSQGDEEYVTFLTTKKTFILSLFNFGEKINLRTLGFFIDSFKKVFETVKGSKYENEIVADYTISFVLYSIEQKTGHNKEELHLLDRSQYKIDYGFYSQREQNSPLQQEKKFDYLADFTNRYKSVISKFRSNNLFIDYIFCGYLDIARLKDDIASLVSEYDKQRLTPEGKVYRSLETMTSIKDEDVIPQISQMLLYVKDDKYNLYDLLNVYALLLKYDYWKIGDFELSEEMDAEFKSSMKRQQDRHVFNEMFDIRTPFFDNTAQNQRQFQKYNAMKGYAIEINRQSKQKKDTADGETYVKVAKEGDVNKLQTYRENTKNRISVMGIDWGEILNILFTATNPVACEVCADIISFVPDSYVIGPDESDRIKTEFLPALDNYLSQDDNRLRKLYIHNLRNHLKVALQ